MRIIKRLVLAVIIFSSCNKTSVDTTNYYIAFSATLNGASQVPANASAAKGTVAAIYNKNTGILTVNVKWTGMTATALHIHKGASGVSGATVFSFNGIVSPINFTSPVLNATQENDLLSNLYYIDIHSTAYTNGEIRGQLIKQ